MKVGNYLIQGVSGKEMSRAQMVCRVGAVVLGTLAMMAGVAGLLGKIPVGSPGAAICISVGGLMNIASLVHVRKLEGFVQTRIDPVGAFERFGDL